MGLLSLLTSRRNALHRFSEPAVGQQAYRSTVASPPPTRGPHSVGHVAPEQLPRVAARENSQPQLASPAKPFFLGIRDQRPSGSPDQDPADWRSESSGRSPRDTSRGFHFSSVLSKKGRGRRNHRPDGDSRSLAPSTRSSVAYSNAESYAGLGRIGRHVDILDAHSEIRPSDFKLRVKAAGAKDYGEDVAERNIDQPSPSSQAYYASSTCGSALSCAVPETVTETVTETGHRTSRSVVTIPAYAQSEEQSGPARTGACRRNSSTSGANRVVLERQPRAQTGPSLDPTNLLSHINESVAYTSADRGRRGETDERIGNRRASTPQSWISTERRRPNDRVQEQGADRSSSPRATRSRSRNRSASPPIVPRYRPRSVQPSSVASISTMTRQKHPFQSRGMDAHHRARSSSVASRPGMRNLDKVAETSPLHPNIPYVARAPREQHHTPGTTSGAHSSDEGSISESAPAPTISARRDEHPPSLAFGKSAAHPQWKSPWSHAHRDSTNSQAAPLGLSIAFAHSRDGSWRSCTYVNAYTQPDDPAGNVPDRRSSLRQWSISSITPTTEMSDHSSIPTTRPRSTHTADTSVDLPCSLVSVKSVDLQGPPGSSGSHDCPSSSPYVTALEDDTDTDTSAALSSPSRAGPDKSQSGGKGNGGDLEVDDSDCFSTDDSDVDSFTEKRRRVIRDDESLLFKEDGYGDAGNSLPGLEDTAAQSPCLMCSLLDGATVDASSEATSTRPWASRAPCSHRGPITRRDRLRALGYEYDTDDSNSEPEPEPEPEPESISRGRTLTQRTTVSTSSMCYRPPIGSQIDEDVEEEHKIKAAPRQARTSKNRITERNMRRGIEPVLEDYEEGNAADVE